MDRQQMLRDGAREMLDIILFFGLETKGQIRASVDGMTQKLLDNWEPLIRADERARGRGLAEEIFLAEAADARKTLAADLRERVEGLRTFWRPLGIGMVHVPMVRIDDVLALLDGGGE